VVGQRFEKPFVGLPPVWAVSALTAILKKALPTVEMDLFSPTPFFELPLIAGCQTLLVELKGSETGLTGKLSETTKLLGGVFSEQKMSSLKRKEFFGLPANLQAFSFEPGLIYTFDIYQHQFDVAAFEALVGPVRIDLAGFMNGQPLHMMARHKNSRTIENEYLWDFELWHENILQGFNEIESAAYTKTGTGGSHPEPQQDDYCFSFEHTEDDEEGQSHQLPPVLDVVDDEEDIY